MPSTAIQIRNLNFSYRAKQVLFDLNIDIPRGITALVGVNGAGKTTLIRNILGDLKGDGTLRFFASDGTSVSSAGVRDRLGYLPQSFGFPPSLTVAEFVAYFAWLRGIPRRDREQATLAALRKVNLTDQYRSKMRALSGGMLRRAGIAQALVHAPDLILLDEPTAGLDPQQRLDLREMLADLARETPILISTHLLEDVAEWEAHMIILDRGRIRFTGDTKALLAETGEATNLERAFIAMTKQQTAEVNS